MSINIISFQPEQPEFGSSQLLKTCNCDFNILCEHCLTVQLKDPISPVNRIRIKKIVNDIINKNDNIEKINEHQGHLYDW